MYGVWAILKLIYVLIIAFLLGNSAVGAFSSSPISEEIAENNSIEDNWSMYMHDANHTGASKYTVPDKVSVKWKANIIDGGYVTAGITLYKGKVFAGTWDTLVYGDNWSAMFGCLDEKTGKSLWNFAAEGYKVQTSCIVNDKAYITSTSIGQQQTDYGVYVYCLDINTGEQIWRRWFFYTTSYSQPTVADGKVFIGLQEGLLVAMDAETGEDVWRYQAERLRGAPAVDGKVAYFSCEDGKLYALSTDAKMFTKFPMLAKPEVKWTCDLGGVGGTPVVYKDRIYIAVGDTLHAIDKNTGKEVWKTESLGPNLFDPAVAHDNIFIGAGRSFYCLNNEGKTIWKTNYTKAIYSPPILCGDDRIVFTYGNVGNYTNCTCISQKDGKPIWEINYSANYNSGIIPCIGKYGVCVGDWGGNIYLIGFNDTSTSNIGGEKDQTTTIIGISAVSIIAILAVAYLVFFRKRFKKTRRL